MEFHAVSKGLVKSLFDSLGYYRSAAFLRSTYNLADDGPFTVSASLQVCAVREIELERLADYFRRNGSTLPVDRSTDPYVLRQLDLLTYLVDTLPKAPRMLSGTIQSEGWPSAESRLRVIDRHDWRFLITVDLRARKITIEYAEDLGEHAAVAVSDTFARFLECAH